MNVRRRCAVALAATAVLGAAAAPAVAADPSPSPSSPALPSGLYGTTDPTYDGVWRQSLALLAQTTADVRPADKAVDWLTGQQCADGAFAPYRADPAAKCDAETPVDTNSTAAAVQALAAVGGQQKTVKDAVAWLKSVQNEDGGWGYTPGGASDANSTSVVIGALTAVTTHLSKVVNGGKAPYDALLSFALPCGDADGDGDGGGAFAFQPDDKGKLTANADATAAGVLGALGKGLAPEAGKAATPTCADGSGTAGPERAAANGAAWLADAVAKDGHLTSALAGAEDQPDYGNTADAVVALAAQGGAERAAKPLAWLEENAGDWASRSGPAAYAQLIFAAHATGTDPRDFGGTDLVAALNATGPEPDATAEQDSGSKDSDSEGTDSEGADSEDSGFGTWWYVGVCLVFGIGIGFLVSGRNRKRQP
ncbi:prenyltransferase/squalene oxidase repeat-containing protein [Streptomyces sp. CRN 30]|uniref:prenyltransferase/squalene oxidase repeat-containing protein n=1 Tax=Streptomyces sp. CRN 30 TaxID=3075613 RepID=UPI002A83DF12|nr:prenyltransferase/squalene oxidase repeat-containing protein [Streptomyces sp. CRN 30]